MKFMTREFSALPSMDFCLHLPVRVENYIHLIGTCWSTVEAKNAAVTEYDVAVMTRLCMR